MKKEELQPGDRVTIYNHCGGTDGNGVFIGRVCQWYWRDPKTGKMVYGENPTSTVDLQPSYYGTHGHRLDGAYQEPHEPKTICYRSKALGDNGLIYVEESGGSIILPEIVYD